ncbi:hypothetical protein HYW75_06490 [Candidatus Pacearchaeota archaeon]|nr:hypothetical protein [Candidatus Pacearchaeota archaeon]
MNIKKIGLSFIFLFMVFSLFINEVSAAPTSTTPFGPADLWSGIQKIFGFLDDPVSLPGASSALYYDLTWGMALLLTFVVYIIVVSLLRRVHFLSEEMGKVKLLTFLLSFAIVVYGGLGIWLAPLLGVIGFGTGLFAWIWVILGLVAALFLTFGKAGGIGASFYEGGQRLADRIGRATNRGIERGLIRQERRTVHQARKAVRGRRSNEMRQYVQNLDRNLRGQVVYFQNIRRQIVALPNTQRIGGRGKNQVLSEIDSALQLTANEHNSLRNARTWEEMDRILATIEQQTRIVARIDRDLRTALRRRRP